ncbi:hypothetical protein [Micromonospora taraxaci]|uniref:hypothetical protein n=1 Tax=Micromonospora taraxaci TaxID=1316803 RepID=UPI0033BF71CE
MSARAKSLAAHVGVASLFTVAWEVAIAMPAGPADVALVVAGVVGPPAAAAVSFALIVTAKATQAAPAAPTVQRRAVASPQRKAVTR